LFASRWIASFLLVSIGFSPAPVTGAGEGQGQRHATATANPPEAAALPPPPGDPPARELTNTPPWPPEPIDQDARDRCASCQGDVLEDALGPTPDEKFWFRADYLQWWTKGTRLPPLVTTSPDGTPLAQAGVLGQPETRVLYGGQHVNTDSRSGYRLSAGMWLNACHTVAFVADYFELEAGSARFDAAGNGSPILARPFYNVQTGQQAAQLISFPNVATGSVHVLDRDFFQSTGGQLLFNLLSSQWCSSDCSNAASSHAAHKRGYEVGFLAGYRYYRLDDSLSIRENLTATDPIFNGTTFDIADGFRTENDFNGAEIGFRTRVYRGRWSVGLLTKIAIGSNHQVVTIDGSTITTLPGQQPVTAQGGVLATETNIGRYTHDQFTVIPQLGLDVGYDLAESLRVVVGYDLIYWPHVQRAAGQIDSTVDPRNLPPVQPGGTIFPQPQLVSTDFWAQGVNVGVEFRY